MRKKSNDQLKNKYLLMVLSVFCAALILISFINSDLLAPVKQVSGLVITPVQKGINGFGSWLSGLTDNFDDAETLRANNEELQAKVDALTEENAQLIQDREELMRLRELFELDKQFDEYDKIGARIIAKETGNWFQLFTIDKGSLDGIRKDMNVISGGGLVGIVTEVGPNWSTVRSIIDDNSNVSAMISTTSDQCIVAGDLRLIDDGSLNLVKLTDSDNKVHVGDKVVTSYISEKYLPGILIGYISELNNDANNLTKSGFITPVVDFRHLQEVLVVLELKDYQSASSVSEKSEAETEAAQKETEALSPTAEANEESAEVQAAGAAEAGAEEAAQAGEEVPAEGAEEAAEAGE